MQFPWNWLRSYGLWNLRSDGVWGYDFWTMKVMDQAGDLEAPTYYTAETLQQAVQEQRVLPRVLPHWLHPNLTQVLQDPEGWKDSSNVWIVYYRKTLFKVRMFVLHLAVLVMVVDLLLLLLLPRLVHNVRRFDQQPRREHATAQPWNRGSGDWPVW